MAFKRLFFDIETSYCEGWFWRPAFKTSISHEQVFKPSKIICICYKWQGSSKIYSLHWDNGNDKEMIYKFKEIILDADEVVGHNGDKFDLKTFRTRCLDNGVISLPEIKSIDTLKISRSQFNFESNRLDFIGKFLGFGGKIKHQGIDMWHDIIKKNSKKAMKEMIEYCKRDVELLEKVFLKLEGFSKPKTHLAVSEGNDRCDCPYCSSKETQYNTRKVSLSGTIKVVMVCKSCNKFFSVSLKAYENRQKKRKKQIKFKIY